MSKVVKADAAADLAPRACDSAPRGPVRDPDFSRPTAAIMMRMAHVPPILSVYARPAASGAPLQLARACRPVARPHLFELVEGAHFRPEHMDDHVTGVDQHPVAMRHALDPHVAGRRPCAGLRSRDPRSRRPAGWTVPEVTTMKSAIEVLPVRSMVTVSSAFMSSMLARTRRRVSSASGRTLETRSGARRAPARESAGVDRDRFPFTSFTASPRPAKLRRIPKIGTAG